MKKTAAPSINTIDHLRHYPTSAVPETWPLNDLYLNVLERITQKFKEKGLQWKFGLEIEFAPHTISSYQQFLDKEQVTPEDANIIHPPSIPQNEIFRKIQNKPPHNFEETANDLIKYIRKTTLPNDYLVTAKTSKKEIIATLQNFITALSSDKEEIADMAKYNIYLAHMHLLNSNEGGWRDIIEPRFGSYARGNGWWDGPGVAEIRLPVHNDYKKFIINYHRSIEKILRSAEAFNLVPELSRGTPHIHFSLWSENNRNITRMETKADKDLSMRIITGVFGLHQEIPHLLNDFDCLNPAEGLQYSIGHSKFDEIRQTKDTWEIRRSFNRQCIHLARDLAVISAGGLYGLDMKRPDKYRKKKEIDLAHCFAPDIIDIYDQENNEFLSLLSNLCIKQNNRFHVGHFIEKTLPYLREYIGYKNLDKYMALPNTPEIKAGDLSTSTSWICLFKSLRINEDNAIICPNDVPIQIKTHIDSLLLKSKRPILFGIQECPAHGISPLLATTPDILTTTAAKQIFQETERQELYNFYSTLPFERAKRFAESCAQNHIILLRNASQSETAESPRDIVAPHIESMAHLSCDETLYLYLKCGKTGKTHLNNNLINLIRPHYLNKIDNEIEAQKKNKDGSNFIISGLNDARNIIENDIFEISLNTNINYKQIVSSLARSIMNTDLEEFHKQTIFHYLLPNVFMRLYLLKNEKNTPPGSGTERMNKWKKQISEQTISDDELREILKQNSRAPDSEDNAYNNFIQNKLNNLKQQIELLPETIEELFNMNEKTKKEEATQELPAPQI